MNRWGRRSCAAGVLLVVGLGLVPASARGDDSQRLQELAQTSGKVAERLRDSVTPQPDRVTLDAARELDDLAKELGVLAKQREEAAKKASSSPTDAQLWGFLMALGVVAPLWRFIASCESAQREKEETLRALAKSMNSPGGVALADAQIKLLTALFAKLQLPLPDNVAKLTEQTVKDVNALSEVINKARAELAKGITGLEEARWAIMHEPSTRPGQTEPPPAGPRTG